MVNLNSEVGLGLLVNNKTGRVFHTLASWKALDWTIEPVALLRGGGLSRLET